jgi:hypothetical protein
MEPRTGIGCNLFINSLLQEESLPSALGGVSSLGASMRENVWSDFA